MTLESTNVLYDDPQLNPGLFAKGDPPPNGKEEPPPEGDPPPNGRHEPPATDGLGEPPPNGSD